MGILGKGMAWLALITRCHLDHGVATALLVCLSLLLVSFLLSEVACNEAVFVNVKGGAFQKPKRSRLSRKGLFEKRRKQIQKEGERRWSVWPRNASRSGVFFVALPSCAALRDRGANAITRRGEASVTWASSWSSLPVWSGQSWIEAVNSLSHAASSLV